MSVEGVYERGAGLDGPKPTVVAGVLVSGPQGPARPQATGRTFGTMTDDREQLARWWQDQGVRGRRPHHPGHGRASAA